MKPTVRLESVKFSDGTTISFPDSEIIVFVGPNNSGKSISLREIRSRFETLDRRDGVALQSARLKTSGSVDDVRGWLERSARKSPDGYSYKMLDAGIELNMVHHRWEVREKGNNTFSAGLGELAAFFCCLVTADKRLSASDPAENIKLTEMPLTHPIHYMQMDDNVEDTISRHFRKAFAQDLAIHRNAGGEVPLLCGQKPTPKQGEDRLSFAHLAELEEKMLPLHEQGDGMRSFVGVLLHSLVVDHDVVLIDEPEAFLHPPQARLLGRMLAKEVTNKQLFLATHSGDFLRGLLDANVAAIRIVRLRRDGNVNIVRQLEQGDVQRLWADPLLRHSNVLDGLFHEKVVVCESDADCRFYAAVFDALYDSAPDVPKPDLMFLHCGGKHRIPTVVGALRTVGVPAAAVVDFDVFNAERPLRQIFEKLGGEWNEISNDWRLVKSNIDGKKAELNAVEVTREIETEISAVRAGYFPKETAERIKGILNRSSPWSIAKTVGKQYVPSGDPTQACDRLLKRLRAAGLFVVEVGQLEGFVRSIGGHGPDWVNNVLSQKKDLLGDPELALARDFVRVVAG